MTSRVRRAQHGDVPHLIELMREFYAEANYPLPTAAAAQAFRRLLDQPELGAIWLMEHDGQPAGYAVLTVGYSMEFGGLRGFVDDLFVKAACRRLGLAKEALAEIRRECTNRGVRALLVETGHDNDAARPLYAGFGFEDSGRLLLTLPLEAPVHEE